MVKIPKALLDRLTDVLAYAAPLTQLDNVELRKHTYCAGVSQYLTPSCSMNVAINVVSESLAIGHWIR